MTVLEHTTSVEYVTVLVLSTNVDVLISQKAIVTVTETNLTLLMSVVATVLLTLTLTESATT